MLQSAAAGRAFELEQEKSQTRDAYGRQKFGQSVLLARRLLEAGVRLVQVNWPREPNDMSTGFPVWDTHKNNSHRLRTVLCPQFDLAFSALIEDLAQRRPARGNAGRSYGRIRPIPENQRRRRTRSLGQLLLTRTRRGGNWRRTAHWRKRQRRRFPSQPAIAPTGPGGNDIPSPRHQPRRRFPRSARQAKSSYQWGNGDPGSGGVINLQGVLASNYTPPAKIPARPRGR